MMKATDMAPKWALITAATTPKLTAPPMTRRAWGALIAAHSNARTTLATIISARNHTPPPHVAATAAGASTTADAALRAISRPLTAIRLSRAQA